MTIRCVFCFLLVFLAVFLEIVSGCFGIVFPLIPAMVFYIAYAIGGRYGFASAVTGGMLRDFAFGFEMPWSVIFLLLITALAVSWLCAAESKSLFSLTLPGALIMILFVFPLSLLQGEMNLVSLAGALSDTVLCALLFSFLFPLLILVLDPAAEKLGIGTYGDAKERFLQKKRS